MKLPRFAPAALIVLALSGPAAAAAGTELRVETVARGLEHPWSLAFLPDGRMLVTERPGRLRIIDGGRVSPPVANVPPVLALGQGGLFEVLPAPDFAQSRRLYLSFAHGPAHANATRLVSARLEAGSLQDLRVLFTAEPAKSTALHFGGRMAWLPDGTLVLTVGDGYAHKDLAQRLDNHLGKILRLNADGSAAPDNPFAGRAGVRAEIYTYGHRNPQGIVYDAATRRLYAHEHGPKGGDELNLIRPGRNYGWPKVTFGVDYSGAEISPHTALPGLEPPLLHWTPSIAPAGLALHRGDLYAAALVGRQLRRIRLAGDGIAGQDVLLAELGERLREVRTGPDGALYLLTDAPDGRLLRLRP